MYLFYSLKHNIHIATHWWDINYIRATCFGCKTAIIRPMQNIYKIQYKCALYGIPYSTSLYCTLYMFCIGLMMAVLRPKHVALMYVIDISSLCWCTYVVFCTVKYTNLLLHNEMAPTEKRIKYWFKDFVAEKWASNCDAAQTRLNIFL